MTNGQFLKVYKNDDLQKYICAQARRHFKYSDDIEDAKQEAWIAVFNTESGQKPELYMKMAFRAIKAMHERNRLLAKKEIPNSLWSGQ
jgi:DNA-directed RNA polymerase specialized sigma24 family protein